MPAAHPVRKFGFGITVGGVSQDMDAKGLSDECYCNSGVPTSLGARWISPVANRRTEGCVPRCYPGLSQGTQGAPCAPISVEWSTRRTLRIRGSKPPRSTEGNACPGPLSDLLQLVPSPYRPECVMPPWISDVGSRVDRLLHLPVCPVFSGRSNWRPGPPGKAGGRTGSPGPHDSRCPAGRPVVPRFLCLRPPR